MDKRARYRKSAVRSTDQALHPLGKTNELTKEAKDKEKKKVTIQEEDKKEEQKPAKKKVVIMEVSEEDSDDKDNISAEPRSKPSDKPRGASAKEKPSLKLSKDELSQDRKKRLDEIK